MTSAAASPVRHSYVLDASAVIAFLNQEPGREVVEPVLAISVISTINWAEVVSWLSSTRNLTGVDLDETRDVLERQGLSTTPVTQTQAEVAGLLTPQTRHAGWSLGDRMALTLAMELGLPALTSDTRWDLVDVGAQVRQIR